MSRTLVAGGLGVAAGIALGFALADAVLPVPAPPGAPPVAEVPLSSSGGGDPAAARELADCRETLASTQQELADLRQAHEGRPITTFPTDWGSELSEPQVVRAAALGAIEQCGLPLRLLEVDCDEVPCLAWFERLDGSDQVDALLPGCPAWSARYPLLSGTAQGRIETEEGPRRYWMIAMQPAGAELPGGMDNAGKRLALRAEARRQALLVEWEGPEPDPEQRRAEWAAGQQQDMPASTQGQDAGGGPW